MKKKRISAKSQDMIQHLQEQNWELKDLNRQQRELITDVCSQLERERFDCKYWISCHTSQQAFLDAAREEQHKLKFKLKKVHDNYVAAFIVIAGVSFIVGCIV